MTELEAIIALNEAYCRARHRERGTTCACEPGRCVGRDEPVVSWQRVALTLGLSVQHLAGRAAHVAKGARP